MITFHEIRENKNILRRYLGDNMLDLAFKDFKAKKSRAVMCIIGVMMCVLLIGTVNSILYAMVSGLSGDLGTIGANLCFEKNGTAYPPWGSTLTENLGNQVLNHSEVDPQKSTKVLFTPLRSNTTIHPPVVVGLTPGKEQTFIQNNTVYGNISLVGQSKNAVIIGSDIARDYNVTVGGTFNVSGHKFKVIGIMKKVGTDWPISFDRSMVMSLSQAQNVSNMQGLISTVLIRPSGNYSADNTTNSLQKAYPDYSIYSQKDAQNTIDQDLGQYKIFMNMISVFIFIVSMVLIMNVMMMSVKEKTREIGTMRAIGTKRRSIMTLILYESLILSVIGGFIGILLISPTYNLLGTLMGLSNASLISFTTPSMVLTQVAVITLIIGTFSGLLPAYLATRISPIEALRYE